jgi:hypothetical protein
VGAGGVSVEAAVARMVGGAWAESAGVGVTSVVRWLGLMTAELAGSSGAWWTWSGRLLLLSSGSHGRGPGRVRGRRQQGSLGEAGALFGGQGLGLGQPTTVANSATCTASFCPQCVYRNAQKRFKFEFLKFGNWVVQDIG